MSGITKVAMPMLLAVRAASTFAFKSDAQEPETKFVLSVFWLWLNFDLLMLAVEFVKKWNSKKKKSKGKSFALQQMSLALEVEVTKVLTVGQSWRKSQTVVENLLFLKSFWIICVCI